MNLAPDDLQQGLADAARALLARVAPTSELVVPDDPTPIHDRVWQQAAEQGWLALGIREEAGGLDLGVPEQLMVFRELGRFATPGPFLASSLAARLAAGAGETGLAERIGTGEARVGMIVDHLAVDVRDGDLALRLDEAGGELVALEGVTPTPSTDPHTPVATYAAARTVIRHDDPSLLSRGRVLAAAELLGVIEAVRDMSTEYARVRHQFGRPIGSFQAVKHRCADMEIAAVSTIGQVFQAGLYVEVGRPDADLHAAAALVLATKGAFRSASDNILNHGGIGFTWEHPAHLYVKRAVAVERLLGARRATLATVLEPRRHEFR